MCYHLGKRENNIYLFFTCKYILKVSGSIKEKLHSSGSSRVGTRMSRRLDCVPLLYAVVFITWGFHICKFAYLLKFTATPKSILWCPPGHSQMCAEH